MQIPTLVPSQSCCARQLPQRGSQGGIPINPNSPQGSLPAAFSQFRFSFLVVRKYIRKYPPRMVTRGMAYIVPTVRPLV